MDTVVLRSYRTYVYYKHLALSGFLWKFQKLFVHEILKARQSTDPMEAERHLKRRNRIFQAKFNNLFKNYNSKICSSCTASCCGGGFSRFSNMDCYLYGIDFSKGKFEYREISSLFIRFYNKIKRSIKPAVSAGKSAAKQKENCPNLGDAGCALPLGLRPLTCVEGICLDLMSTLSTKDLKIYSKLIGSYSRFKTRCAFAVARTVLKEKFNHEPHLSDKPKTTK